jgi:hypothetical protein
MDNTNNSKIFCIDFPLAENSICNEIDTNEDGKVIYVEAYSVPADNWNDTVLWSKRISECRLVAKYFYDNDSTYYAKYYSINKDVVSSEGEISVDFKHRAVDTIDVVDTSGIQTKRTEPGCYLTYKSNLWKEYTLNNIKSDKPFLTIGIINFWQGQYKNDKKTGVWTFYCDGLPVEERNYTTDSTQVKPTFQNRINGFLSIGAYLIGDSSEWIYLSDDGKYNDSIIHLGAEMDYASDYKTAHIKFYSDYSYKISTNSVDEAANRFGRYEIKKLKDTPALILTGDDKSTQVYDIKYIDKDNILLFSDKTQ